MELDNEIAIECELSGDDPCQHFRASVHTSLFEPYVFAMAKASTRMDRIKQIQLRAHVNFDSQIVIDFFAGRTAPKWVITKAEAAQWTIDESVITCLERTANGPGSVFVKTVPRNEDVMVGLRM